MDFERESYLKMRDIKISDEIPRSCMQSLEILIHWIFMVCEKNNLEIKTIELATILIKIYVSKNQFSPEFAELIGIASLMIAVKYNECQSKIQMSVEDCVEQCQSKYSSKQVLEMEMNILTLIEYDANITTITDYFDGEITQIDLVLFVTLDSDFLYYQKYQLFDAIRNFYTKDTQNLSMEIQNLISKISSKILQLTSSEKEQKPQLRKKNIRKINKRRSIRKQSSQSQSMII